jgi:hypothetical protein
LLVQIQINALGLKVRQQRHELLQGSPELVD